MLAIIHIDNIIETPEKTQSRQKPLTVIYSKLVRKTVKQFEKNAAVKKHSAKKIGQLKENSSIKLLSMTKKPKDSIL